MGYPKSLLTTVGFWRPVNPQKQTSNFGNYVLFLATANLKNNTWVHSFEEEIFTIREIYKKIPEGTLIRLGAATHSYDMDQRFVPLEFTASLNTVTIAAPAHGFLAPPGYYMLFILKDGDRAGIKYPSLAEIIKLAPPPT